MAIDWSYMNPDIKAEISKLRDDLAGVVDALERAGLYKDDTESYKLNKEAYITELTNRRFVNKQQICLMLGIDKNTTYHRWLKSGKLLPITKGQQILFLMDDILKIEEYKKIYKKV
ncbi:helix-turn-helix domain-containing protein [Flavobacteriaceae bacterium]|nr:helix-turn-helix domain-containing protein [Flavobacteriaceae bacterium]